MFTLNLPKVKLASLEFLFLFFGEKILTLPECGKNSHVGKMEVIMKKHPRAHVGFPQNDDPSHTEVRL